jgi:phage baseplate assembly protein W|tara:strand:- start:20003 stop:20371 length:369 start_codon:yes stop_codon:yes gene_type:complete
MATIFRGFNTVDKNKAPFTLSDEELIKRDLLNHFYTRRGERFMRPNFGSMIHDIIMNPMDAMTESDVREDIERIIETDSRVRLDDIRMLVEDHTVRCEVDISFNVLRTSDTLYLEFINEELV